MAPPASSSASASPNASAWRETIPLGFFLRVCYSTGVANVARSKKVVVIAPDLREKFGWGDEGEIIEVECDGEMVSFLLPPVHNESLAGSLAPYIKRTLSEDEWDEARGRLDPVDRESTR